MAETYQIIVANTAKKDINDILDYLQENVSHQEAVDTRQAILSAIRELETMPYARSPVKESIKPTKPITLRQIVAKKVYRIIYRIEEVAKDVVVVRVIHVKRGKDYVKRAIRSL
ncbi:MAG: type II toxin-antitoxin system RelE/ParE family toxin [Bacteroidetes bacterium]|jgi:plasmid stabilization system protein ParE|nr:type II toxin-antitoxin system RelE/ParE family toxin [Bacteroidota bacterium]